ncbi:RICIN domain-containing protein [Saccharomonospora iraqiensis]|uniref:RICIN domain-containing protein n=1 Tax=Saccharomonospora iraqiensis TaxID=52698 RepID=UPI00022E03A8|nr:hypothetical protein [Saccharomonospora iraqiensis]
MTLRRKSVLGGVAVAALASTMLTGTAHAQSSAAPTDPVVITNHAYTNYVIPDDTVGNPGTFLQVYYRSDHPISRTFHFESVYGEHQVYRWKSARTGTCAEADGEAGKSVYLRTCNGSKTQWWLVRRVGDTSRWVLTPYMNESLAFTAKYGDDNYAPLRELPSRNTATASQQWHFTPQ